MRFGHSLIVALAIALGGCSLFSARFEERHREAIDAHAVGLTLEADEQWSEAALAFQRSLNIAETPAAHTHLGICQMEMGDLDSAEAHLRRALELSPSYALAENHLLEIEARRSMNTEPEAVAVTPSEPMELPVEEEPERPTVEEARALLFPNLHGEEAAPSGAMRMREGSLNSPEFHLAQARGFERGGDNLSALREYRLAQDGDPTRIDALLGAARLRAQMGHEVEAMSLWNEASTIQPNNSEVPMQIGNYLFREGRTEEAIVQYERVVEMDSTNVQALNNLGAAQRDQGRLVEALETLGRAVEIDPTYAPPHRNIGNIHDERGEDRAALEAYREYVRLGGDQSDLVSRWIREIEIRLGE